ncbi:uncharacterized protein LOC110809309 [Carica papaya]|uniref:uncharacterized protein LOC110809309 n=1 Tax=Carica papaya TaxID=3649 RepID=UPI000B8CE8EE|nr:uncharacterized protein LOC110809309 [Carica papaya]
MALFATTSMLSHSVSAPSLRRNLPKLRRSFLPLASLSVPSPESSSSPTNTETVSSSKTSPSLNSPKPPDSILAFDLSNQNGNPVVRIARSTESNIERTIFNFRFLALLAVGGSLAGSLLCFLNGCVYIFDV